MIPTQQVRRFTKSIFLLIFLTAIVVINACSVVEKPIQEGKAKTQSPELIVESTNPMVDPNPVITKPITTTTHVVHTAYATATPKNLYESIPQPSQTQLSNPTQLPPDFWMTLPIIPEVSQTARDIYLQGIRLGRDPHAFSKIGDCQSITTYFLGSFDYTNYYNLGEYTSLQETIDWFSGSFSRDSLAVKGGFNAAAVLSPLRADPSQCKSDENPIACEFRLHNPSIVIISLEEWWSGHPENYEKYMRQIIEYSIQQGVVPIVATKADNLEGNHLINQTIAKLSVEYDIPLWNFWQAVQPLPNHGLIAKDSTGAVDMFHLTVRNNFYYFNIRSASRSGWSVRNLTALQALDAVRRELSVKP